MISFHICTSEEEFTQLEKDNEALYFIPAYGIYKGDTICADFSSDSITLISAALKTINEVLATKADNSALTSLQSSINQKLNITNPAATGIFTLENSEKSGSKASFEYDDSGLTITLS